jgi:uracil-DNA glycosylase
MIPIGRLAIDRFLGPRPLAALVGRVHPVLVADVETRAVPLPHPSGASGWLNAPAHRALLEDAITLLADEFARVGVVGARQQAA